MRSSLLVVRELLGARLQHQYVVSDATALRRKRKDGACLTLTTALSAATTMVSRDLNVSALAGATMVVTELSKRI